MIGLFRCRYCSFTHGCTSMNVCYHCPERVDETWSMATTIREAEEGPRPLIQRPFNSTKVSPSKYFKAYSPSFRARERFSSKIILSVYQPFVLSSPFRFHCDVRLGGLHSEKSFFWWSKRSFDLFGCLCFIGHVPSILAPFLVCAPFKVNLWIDSNAASEIAASIYFEFECKCNTFESSILLCDRQDYSIKSKLFKFQTQKK